MLAACAKIQNLRKILGEKVLRQFDNLCSQVGRTTITHLYRNILGLDTYFFSVNVLPNKKCAMCRRTRNPRKLKVRRYADNLNEYLDALPGAKSSDNIG